MYDSLFEYLLLLLFFFLANKNLPPQFEQYNFYQGSILIRVLWARNGTGSCVVLEGFAACHKEMSQ